MRFACSLCIGDVQKGRVLPSSSEWALVNLPKLPPTSIEAGVFNICKNVISRKYLHWVIHEMAFVSWCLMSTPRKLWTHICVLLLEPASKLLQTEALLMLFFLSLPKPKAVHPIMLSSSHPRCSHLSNCHHPPPPLHTFLPVSELPFCSPAT